MTLTTQLTGDRQQDGARWIDVAPENWHSLHAELQREGYVRLEWLASVHEGDDNFQIVTRVTDVDVQSPVMVSMHCDSSEPVTLSDLFPIAQFHEQEARQLLGVQFAGLADGVAFDAPIEGHPLRRDFALQARLDKPWPGAVEPDAQARRRLTLPPGVLAEWQL